MTKVCPPEQNSAKLSVICNSELQRRSLIYPLRSVPRRTCLLHCGKVLPGVRRGFPKGILKSLIAGITTLMKAAAIAFASALFPYATGFAQTHAISDSLASGEACTRIIEQDIQAQNDLDTTTFLNLRADTCGGQNKTIYRKLWQERPKSNFMLNLVSAKLIAAKRIPLKVVQNFFQLESFTKCYHQLACFYVAIDYHLKRETTYMYNGTNYRLYILGEDKDRWSILEASQAPIESLRKWGYGFETEQEKAAEKIQVLKQRTGKSFDLQGKRILPENTNDKRRSK